MLFLLFLPLAGKAQNSFLQVLSVPSSSLTSSEQSKLNQIVQQPVVLNYWHISIDNFDSALNGRLLQANLPNEASTTFEADFPYSEQPGTYNWVGYNLDGSYFKIYKWQDGVAGNAYLSASDNYYGIISLSTTRIILVRYDKEIMKGQDSCGTESDQDDLEDDEVEERGGCQANIIRVLFLFTPAAAAGASVPATVAQTVISELNSTGNASGVDAIFVQANVALLPGFVENSDIKDDLKDVCDNSTAKNLRDASYADIVVLLTGPHPGLSAIGIADQTASNKRAYAVAEIVPAGDGTMTATHEVGHLLGGRHQRCSTCNVGACQNATKHHGFLVGTTMKTTMTQLTCQAAQTRIGRWSNPDTPFMGLATGNDDNNNAKKINERAGKVCCFRDDPPPSGGGGAQFQVEITGAGQVCSTQQYIPYQSSVIPASNGYSYLWEVSETGIGNYTQVSTSSSWILMNASTLPGTWTTVRLTVTDANNSASWDFFEIHRVTCFGGGKGVEERSSSNTNQNLDVPSDGQVLVTPNPASETLTVKGINEWSTITILDMNGRVFAKSYPTKEDGNELSLSIANFSSGVYIVSVKKPDQHLPIKIKFVKL